MASAPVILLFTAFISLLSTGTKVHGGGYAVRCYQCSVSTPKCQDPFSPDDTTPLVQCAPNQVCAKKVASYNGQVNTNRFCIFKDLPLPTDSARIYKCDTDGCNSAPQHYSLLPVIVTMTAAAYMGTKL